MKLKQSKRSGGKAMIGNAIPRELSEEFDRFIKDNGYIKGRAIAAAFRIFIDADPSIRIAAFSSLNAESN